MYPALRVMTDMPSIRTVIAVIRICRRLHPEPWYYRRDPIQDGIEFTNLPPVLQYLESEKLVEKVHDPISGEKGVCLSERGLRVADDPAAMERLAEGVAMDPSEVGPGSFRAGLRRSSTVPWMISATGAGERGQCSPGAVACSTSRGRTTRPCRIYRVELPTRLTSLKSFNTQGSVKRSSTYSMAVGGVCWRRTSFISDFCIWR
jgi:hypothetical protein